MFKVLKYIHDHITDPLSIEEVADFFGYSKWHFCRKFREYTHTTFIEYVRHYRIQLASIDILQGKKLTKVAMDYGYDTVGGFNKAFLKEYGCFPTEYKKQAKESQLYYERKKQSMYQLSDRCSYLRNEMVNLKSHMKHYAQQRCVYFALGCAEAVKNGLSDAEAFGAAGTEAVLNRFTPYICPHELITGFNYADARWGDNFFANDREAHTSILRDSGISEEDIEAYFALDPYYRSGGCLRGNKPQKRPASEPRTQSENEAVREMSANGFCLTDNHSVIDYQKVLEIGFEGIYQEIERYEQQNGTAPFYRAAKRVCAAAMQIGEKYAKEARRLLDEGAPEYEAADLEFIEAVCSRVPRYPASTLAEAIQSLWFAHIINTWEDGINANSLGHLDQILYPYYQADLEKGLLTKEGAFELICCLWLKLYRDYDVQQSCVGGTNPDGSSAVNELSYMMLDATEALDFVRCLSVRYSQKTEKEFLKRALEVVGHVQKGVPFFFNDDVMIPALVSGGISREDACDYTQIGCVETVIPGKSNPHAVTGKSNLLKAIEYALANGQSMMYPELSPGLQTGTLDQLDSFEAFYGAVLKQIDRILDLTCSMIKKASDAAAAYKPYKSILTEGCLESGKDFNQKGALYDYYQVMLMGIPNLADSLAAIQKFVYTEQKYTLAELKEILDGDFPDERVRQEFINKAPKFGNDLHEVDSIAVSLTEHACDTLTQLSETYGLHFHAQPFTYLWMIDHGLHCAATPDGRRRGEIIAYSVSPMQGRDFNGLTALLNSISKLPTKKTPGTTSAIVEVDPKLFTDRNIGLLTDVLLASSQKGLSNVQFNTVDVDTLIDPKAHPEKYNNLALRVSGFSQKFNLLKPELQDHIIGRTKHKCL